MARPADPQSGIADPLGPKNGGVDTAAVRGHYAALAASYDARANRACKRAYRDLVQRCLAGARQVLELGSGSSPLLGEIDARMCVGSDVSLAMLGARRWGTVLHRVGANAVQLPFRAGSFDAAYCINLLEHIPDPAAAIAEAARVLSPGGRLLAVTPNGDCARLLELLERLHLKLPEGPHRFLTPAELSRMSLARFELLEHRRILAFPLGPRGFVEMVDRVLGTGLFQYILLKKRP